MHMGHITGRRKKFNQKKSKLKVWHSYRKKLKSHCHTSETQKSVCFYMQSLPTANFSLVWPNFCTPYWPCYTSTSDVNPDHLGLPDPDPGSKKLSKSWGTRIRIDRNRHNIIYINIEITQLFNAHKWLANTKHEKSFLVSIISFMGKKSVWKFGIFLILGRIRIRIQSRIHRIRIHITDINPTCLWISPKILSKNVLYLYIQNFSSC